MRLFARGGDHREGDFARKVSEVRHFAKTYADHNIYIAPNPTNATGGARHSAVDVTHWSYFLIDMDPVCTCDPDRRKKKLPRCVTCRGGAEPLTAIEKALLWIGEWTGRDFGKNRPIIIDSGRGCQAWIRLADIPVVDNVPRGRIVAVADAGGGSEEVIHRETARRVNGYWLKRLDTHLGVTHGCRIDTSVSDLPRVMRCPGTINIKTGRQATFIHATDRVFGGFAHLLSHVPPQYLEDPDPPQDVAPGQTWQAVFLHLTRMSQTYLTQGQAEPGRHKVMWHTAKNLQERGVTRAQARKALRWANELQGKDEELHSDQVKHALDTAYGA